MIHRRPFTVVMVTWLAMGGLLSPPAMAATDQEIINQARQAYYNLKVAGLTEFRCDVEPDWDSILTSAQDDETTQDEILPVMQEMHFGVLVGPDGVSTVSRKFNVAPPDEQAAERSSQIADGIEQIITGFYQIWSLFLVNSPFPQPGTDFKLSDAGGKYRLFAKEGSNDVSISMGHDFIIDEIEVASDEFHATTRPLFAHEGTGLVLKSYQTTMNMASGTTVQVNVAIENGEYGGFTLPHTIAANLPRPDGSVSIALTFSNYQLKKR